MLATQNGSSPVLTISSSPIILACSLSTKDSDWCGEVELALQLSLYIRGQANCGNFSVLFLMVKIPHLETVSITCISMVSVNDVPGLMLYGLYCNVSRKKEIADGNS